MVQGLIVALLFERLVVEVLDGFVVEQAVDGLAVGLGIEPIHFVAIVHAPFGDQEGKRDIHADGAKDGNAEAALILADQDRGDQDEFGRGRQDIEHQVIQDGTDAAGATFQIPRHPTGTPFQVIAQG